PFHLRHSVAKHAHALHREADPVARMALLIVQQPLDDCLATLHPLAGFADIDSVVRPERADPLGGALTFAAPVSGHRPPHFLLVPRSAFAPLCFRQPGAKPHAKQQRAPRGEDGPRHPDVVETAGFHPCPPVAAPPAACCCMFFKSAAESWSL